MGLQEKTVYEELIEWLENHDGRMPKGNIRRNGKKINKEEMTEAEQKEKNLYARWTRSKEKRVLDACRRNFN